MIHIKEELIEYHGNLHNITCSIINYLQDIHERRLKTLRDFNVFQSYDLKYGD